MNLFTRIIKFMSDIWSWLLVKLHVREKTLNVFDNHDGTWTVVAVPGNLITMVTSDQFLINDADAVYLDPETYIIRDDR